MKSVGHLEDIGESYFVHGWHGFEVAFFLIFCSITSVISSIFPPTYDFFEVKRRKIVNNMYLELMRRWHDVAVDKKDKERRRQRAEKISFLEAIEKNSQKNAEVNIDKTYFKNMISELKKSNDYMQCAISSIIHAVFPEILIDDAAKGLIRIYLKMYYSKDNI
jgi:hypothetical protein